ncbi:hypothetical protein [Rheinheimera sp. A13L]|uniref:hypothetical protein n=1 Tax=Rheinheimera sp. A13L TaxID=506534 RepID=UPI001300EBF4|nr:hypothetical protein [Rheinheimera sp. A13L]
MNLFQLLQANARAVRHSLPDWQWLWQGDGWLDQQQLLNLLCNNAKTKRSVQLSLAR